MFEFWEFDDRDRGGRVKYEVCHRPWPKWNREKERERGREKKGERERERERERESSEAKSK